MFVKAVAAAGTLLMLPVLFLLLLPGLIFGGFQDAQSPRDTTAPILNSETVIVEAVNELELTVNSYETALTASKTLWLCWGVFLLSRLRRFPKHGIF